MILNTDLLHPGKKNKTRYGVYPLGYKYSSQRWSLSPRISSVRQPPITIKSCRTVPIPHVCRVRRRARLGILFRVETFPERGDHLREPEHVQSVQDKISTNVRGKDGAREAVAHLEERLAKLVRYHCAVDETRGGECRK